MNVPLTMIPTVVTKSDQ